MQTHLWCGTCMVMGSPASRSFYREVANVVAAAMLRPWWGLDQYSLYSAYLALKGKSLPSFHLLGPDEAGIEFDNNAYFWFTASSARQALVANTPPSSEQPGLMRYERRYRKFSA